MMVRISGVRSCVVSTSSGTGEGGGDIGGGAVSMWLASSCEDVRTTGLASSWEDARTLDSSLCLLSLCFLVFRILAGVPSGNGEAMGEVMGAGVGTNDDRAAAACISGTMNVDGRSGFNTTVDCMVFVGRPTGTDTTPGTESGGVPLAWNEGMSHCG